MRPEDIVVGIVVSFGGGRITRNTSIRELERNCGMRSQLPDQVRPFVCVGLKDTVCQWAELTTAGQPERLLIPASARTWQDGEERHKPTVRWKRDDHWLNGAVFEGPRQAWAACANEARTADQLRCVTGEMVKTIRNHLEPDLVEPLFPLP